MKCTYPPCRRPTPKGEDYCSDTCHAADSGEYDNNPNF